MTASQLLTGAADHIERHGWIKGNFYDPDTLGTCALGALHFAARNFGRDGEARRAAINEADRALSDVASELHGEPIATIAWNNTGCIDRADAVAWMQKSAAKLEEQGK